MTLSRLSVRIVRGICVALLLVMTVAAFSLGSVALAQGTPTPAAPEDGVHGELDGPLPARTEGDAEWHIGERLYQGEFPDGFSFEIAAESSAGDITSARVVWVHSPGSGTQRSRGAEFDPERGRWVAHWEPASNQVPPWVLVRYHWELTDEQGNRYITAEKDEVYADDSNADRWGHAESEDVVVHWLALPDEVGQQTIDAMAERREFYRQAWGGLLPYRPRVILYGWTARPEYEEAMGNRPILVAGTLLAGTTAADWGGTIQIAQPGSDTRRIAYGTVLHEVAHLYQHQFTRVTPDWFIEGNAEFFSMARSGDYRAYARQRLQSDDPLSFAAGFATSGENFRDGYWIGTTVWDYLVETYGLDAHRRLWELISQNVPRNEAIEQVTGVSIEQFEMDWRTWIGVTSLPPTLIPSPTPLFDPFSFPTPTFPPSGA